VLLLICASLAAPVPGGAAPRDAEGRPRPGPASIYGLELDVSESRERLLVFADRPLEVETSELDPETLMLSIVDAVLDASAESRIAPAPGGSVRHVSAFERADVPTHEVRIVIRRSAGVQPSVSRRGSITALEFPRSEVPARDPGIALAYRAAPVAVVVRDLARAAGETVVHDAELPGRISVVGSERLSSAEALTLMDTILLSRGLAAVPLPGGGRKIVAIAGAPVPWRPALPEDPGDAQVATLVRLASVEAEALLGVLNPLLGAQTLGVAVPSSNALILAGSSARIARLSVAIEALDAEADERRVILRLRHRDAIDVAPLVREVFDARALPDVFPDERTNALILVPVGCPRCAIWWRASTDRRSVRGSSTCCPCSTRTRTASRRSCACSRRARPSAALGEPPPCRDATSRSRSIGPPTPCCCAPIPRRRASWPTCSPSSTGSPPGCWSR
jgi:hypothetical protein